MRKIGVILCSKSKHDYACEAGQMYQTSVLFSARQVFMDMVYDEWYINTSKYGFMKPTMKIEPYDSWYINKTSKNSQLKNNPNILTRDMIDEWLRKVKSQFPNPNEIELHCHLSLNYYKELSKIFPNIVYVKPEVSFTSTAWKYVDACKMLTKGATLDECLEFINKRTKRSRPKETKKWFYHVDGRTFFGNGYDISKEFTEIDNGCMYGLSMGTTQMSHGWVINKDLLPYIQKYPSGRYRLTDGKAKTSRVGQRMNIREEINKYQERYETNRI
jgi:hypothetical protein